MHSRTLVTIAVAGVILAGMSGCGSDSKSDLETGSGPNATAEAETASSYEPPADASAPVMFAWESLGELAGNYIADQISHHRQDNDLDTYEFSGEDLNLQLPENIASFTYNGDYQEYDFCIVDKDGAAVAYYESFYDPETVRLGQYLDSCESDMLLGYENVEHDDNSLYADTEGWVADAALGAQWEASPAREHFSLLTSAVTTGLDEFYDQPDKVEEKLAADDLSLVSYEALPASTDNDRDNYKVCALQEELGYWVAYDSTRYDAPAAGYGTSCEGWL